MKSKPLPVKIQIPKPCSQSWAEMTPEGKGRHCTACAQTVTDFTRMTDVQILEALRSIAGGCGRFRADQLERELSLPPAERRFSFVPFYKMVASLLLVFSAGKVGAQTKKPLITQEANSHQLQGGSRIEGIVIDQYDEPLTGAVVELLGTTLKTIVDIEGYYTLLVPDSALDEGQVELSVSYVGHQTTRAKGLILGQHAKTVINITVASNDSNSHKADYTPAVRPSYTGKPLLQPVAPTAAPRLQAKDVEIMCRLRAIRSTVQVAPGVFQGGRVQGLLTNKEKELVQIVEPKQNMGKAKIALPKKWWQFWKHNPKHQN